ncbi:hypothetical protein BH11PSE11_BH11PSE11_12490 [soil metagenome]
MLQKDEMPSAYTELYSAIGDLYETLRRTEYHGQDDAVIDLIEVSIEAIRSATGKLGPWESQELAYAMDAALLGWLRLALVAVRKALDISQLPKSEYDYGFARATQKPAK